MTSPAAAHAPLIFVTGGVVSSLGKGITAASLAVKGDGTHFVPLDAAIETMRQTGMDMSEKYKETSLGGLAVNVVEC